MNHFFTSQEKLKLSARYWLLGRAVDDHEYYKVYDALEYMLEKHTGKRNGGDAESIHQLRIFHGLRTMHRHLTKPHVKYKAAFLHDTVEDKNVPISEIERLFGSEVADVVNLLSKSELGVERPKENYLPAIFANEHASVVKLGDRNDNISTMVGVFKPERLERYFIETRDQFLPSIKLSRRLFPEQEVVYENYKMQIQNQLNLIGYIVNQNKTQPVSE